MLDGLRALLALEQTGTVSEAATRLRLTQSAVSKRVRALEQELGMKIVEPDGRRLRLTEKGLALLAKAKPLLGEIESLRDLGEESAPRKFSLGMSESIACSWGPRLMRKSLERLAGMDLEIHVHRSTLILEHLRSGRYEIGLLTGVPQGSDLVWDEIAEEAMVLAGSLRGKTILSIETSSATWKEIGKQAAGHSRMNGKEFVHVESFSAAAQMAKEDFGQALIPSGLAKSLGFRETEITRLSPRINRHIHLVARKSMHGLRQIQSFASVIKEFKPG